ncbi:MAG: DNA-processing protein DprA [bacterium]|nr:DNA-processing protein DprA [bacterium]
MSALDDRKLAFFLALYSIPGIGPARFHLLLKHFKDPEEVWNLPRQTLEKILKSKLASQFLQSREQTDPAKLLEEVKSRGIQIVTVEDKTYPKLLKQIHDCPPILFVRGSLENLGKTLAVVGSRNPTSYGREVTEILVKGLVREGFTIVSGLARGVDSLAAQTALEVGGKTVAVLGGGLSRIYPPENLPLAKRILEKGAVVSEYFPEVPSVPGNFPARNRIISGLSLGVLVTEAGAVSGTLITAGFAVEQNREVFAVPGPIYSKLAAGPAELIKQGAKLVMSVGDILEELKMNSESRMQNVQEREIKADTKEEQAILDLLEDEVVHIDEITRRTSFHSAKISSLLTTMELQGKVKSLGNGNYARNH